MKAKGIAVTAAAVLAALLPAMAEAREGAGPYRKHHWRSAYGFHARLAPPIVTVVTPDLYYPVAPYAYNRLDDGYDYPFGYGEYAVYGKWARDALGRPDVARCRLVWFDGPRVRSLNRCN